MIIPIYFCFKIDNFLSACRRMSLFLKMRLSVLFAEPGPVVWRPRVTTAPWVVSAPAQSGGKRWKMHTEELGKEIQKTIFCQFFIPRHAVANSNCVSTVSVWPINPSRSPRKSKEMKSYCPMGRAGLCSLLMDKITLHTWAFHCRLCFNVRKISLF